MSLILSDLSIFGLGLRKREIDGLPKFMFDIRAFMHETPWMNIAVVRYPAASVQNHYAYVLQHDIHNPRQFFSPHCIRNDDRFFYILSD